MARKKVTRLIQRLCEAQARTTERILNSADWESLRKKGPEDFSVQEVLDMWSWHFRSHHRELILARGRLTGENPFNGIDNFVRRTNEEFGRFIGELACLSDDQLDELRLPDGGRTVHEIADHVLETLSGWVPGQIEKAAQKKKE